MKVIALVGSASGSGKTRLASAILRAVPGLGAVKVSPREGAPRVEWGAGEAGKDTDRFTASGAAAVARIVAPRERVAEVWEGIAAAFAGLPGVLVEGAGALACGEERFTVFVAGEATLGKRPGRDERLAAAADWIVLVRASGAVPRAARVPVAGARVGTPLLGVDAADENWDVDALIAAIRAFLSDRSPRGARQPREHRGRAGTER